MKSFVYIALILFFGTVLVQGYGPKIQRKNIWGSSESSHWPQNKPPFGFPHGPPQRPHHHGFPHHWPSHDHFRPPNKHHGWDGNTPIWDDESDSRDNSGESGSHGGGDSYDSYDSISPEKEGSDSSYEDSGDSHDYHHTKRPCKKPTKSTPKTTHEPKPTTPKPIPTTTKIVTPRPTRTVSPIPPITNRPPWQSTTTTEDTIHWETTTNIVPETTTSNPDVETTTEEQFFTISPEMEECINTCPSTPEFNPVCGSDDETYDNEGKLFCAASCTGLNITIRRRSVCPPPSFDGGSEPPGPPPPTTTTTNSPIIGRTTPFSNFQRCMKLCRITPSFTPVCGTDLVTYMNMDRLHCAQSCGEAVEVLCEKPCAACGSNPVTVPTRTTTTATLQPRTTPHIGTSTTQEPGVQECIDACPVTTEYNPICGSNHVTFDNPSHFLCAQLCGVGVVVTRLGPCGSTITTSTTTVALPTTLSPSVLNCIRRCPVTSEYNPVCGTNSLTYNNLGNLHCSKFCGVDVDFKHESRCIDEFDLGPDGTDSTPSQTTQDVNRNKDPENLPWRTTGTATTSSIFTSPTTTTTAMPPTTPTSTSTTKAGPDSSSTLGFTIPRDVLNDIFGSMTTQASATKPTNTDDDEDLDLDARFGNDTDKDTDRSHYSRIIYPD